MRYQVIIIVMAELLVGTALRAATYTNLAGQVVSGQVATLTNGVVSIRTAHGMVQGFAMKTFSTAEQERLLLAVGQPLPLPSELQQCFNYLQDMYIRAGRLQQAGQQSKEATQEQRQKLRIVWQRTLDKALAEKTISPNLHAQWYNTPWAGLPDG